ncbi:MAG: toll/interleukin-1 receptor domain-containing protein [Anaerolineae bacterium]
MNTPTSKANTGKSANASAPLFVSYSRSDRIAVDKLYADLQRRGYVLWMDVDEHGITAGEDWRRDLVESMSKAQAVIACVSPDFLKSPNCRAEIEQAQREGKPIFPVIVRRLDPEATLADFKLDSLQYIDLTQNYDEGLRRLLVALPPPQQPLRSALRIASVIAAAAVTLILLFLGARFAAQQGIESAVPTITAIPPTATLDLKTYDIGVLLSYFVIDPANPIPADQADATIERLGKALDQQLTAELGRSGLNLTYKLDGPVGVRRIVGADPQQRKEDATRLLAERGAKVVIYGEIGYDATLQQPQLTPEFYIASGQYFNDAYDLTGSYAFGQKVPGDSLDERTKLGARVTALSYVMTGVFQQMTQKYSTALVNYQAALNTPEWTEEDGKEVIYALIGGAQMKLAETAARRCDRATVLDRTNDAETAFRQSQQIADVVRPNFSRAYAGLANTYAVRALWLAEQNDKCARSLLTVSALDQAVTYIDQFREKFNLATEDPSVASKLLLTEVQVRFLQWAARFASRDASADDYYQAFFKAASQVIDDYSGRSGLFDSPVMEAHIFRGQSYYARGDNRAALADYDQAMGIYDASKARNPYPLIAPDRAMTVFSLRGDAYVRLRDYTTAAAQYGEALKLAQALNNTTAAERYAARQKQADAWAISSPTPTSPPATATALPTETETVAVTVTVTRTPSYSSHADAN